MFKKGLVLDIESNKVSILTNDGEFLYVLRNFITPEIGQEYEGKLYKDNFSFLQNFKLKSHKFITAATLLLLFNGLIAYNLLFSVYETYEVKINPDIKLYTNRLGKVIKTEGVNEDGNIVLSKLSLKSMSIESAVESIVVLSKDLNYLNENNSQVSVKSSDGIEKIFPNVEGRVSTYNEDFKRNKNSDDKLSPSENSNTAPALKENNKHIKDQEDSFKDNNSDSNSTKNKNINDVPSDINTDGTFEKNKNNNGNKDTNSKNDDTNDKNTPPISPGNSNSNNDKNKNKTK